MKPVRLSAGALSTPHWLRSASSFRFWHWLALLPAHPTDDTGTNRFYKQVVDRTHWQRTAIAIILVNFRPHRRYDHGIEAPSYLAVPADASPLLLSSIGNALAIS